MPRPSYVLLLALAAGCQKPPQTVEATLSCYLDRSQKIGDAPIGRLNKEISCWIDLAPGQNGLRLAATIQTSFAVKKNGTVQNILVPEQRGSVFSLDSQPGSNGDNNDPWNAFVAELWPAHVPYDPSLRGDFLPCTDFDVYANLFDKGKLVWHAVKRIEQDCRRR